jgi:hypothetical protein
MALIPLFACGWENGLIEGNATDGATPPTVSNTKAFTGTYSLRVQKEAHAYGRVIPATNELRAAAMFNHNGVANPFGSPAAQAVIFLMAAGSGVKWKVIWHNDENVFRLLQNDTTVAEIAETGANFTTVDAWRASSVAFKANASTGYFAWYVEGEEVLSFEGDTGSSDIVSVLVGGHTTANLNRWADFLYVDDFWAASAVGEGAGPLSNRRFLWGQASGNGQSSQWAGSDGNTTDNYLLVDDGVTPDSDTTYVKAESGGLVDQYTHAAITVPADWRPVRVWPTVIAKKTDAGVATTLELGLWKASSSEDSAPITLPTSYGMVQAYFDDLPDGSSIADEGNINALEIRVESAGAYS